MVLKRAPLVLLARPDRAVRGWSREWVATMKDVFVRRFRIFSGSESGDVEGHMTLVRGDDRQMPSTAASMIGEEGAKGE